MLEPVLNLEVLQVAIGVPTALAGAGFATIVRRRPSALIPCLFAFAAVCALLGSLPFAFEEPLRLAADDRHSLLVVLKYAAVFGLLLILGATGLAPSRHREPAA